MRSISYKQTVLVGLFFSTALTATATSAYDSMNSTVKTMKREAAKENLSSGYEQKLTGNLDSLENSISQAMRLGKNTGGRPARGDVSEGDAAIVKVAMLAAESLKLEQISKKLRKDLLRELERIEPRLRSKSDVDLLEDAGFAIGKLQDSLGIDDTSFGKSRSRRARRAR